ncbi:MAG TPA: bifunctional diaminohydroxyphosphoribosylaminopyrimidine deaminase/5-amino-6-(5-phosphoribosylamino)uracil reductase RibD [Lacipirellulaceae bacterium]|nr:bifunctional diaminohydroxyphosphoribosylaminopyrimidine deaminase/5-amino-6-(5-phosphoribosylamino)uracil reductase RibD [Lacipirellulaceae bacterium]
MTPEDRQYRERALELARRGEGRVEPNPMVGCVLVRGGQVVGEGWHQAFGGPHAEVEALRAAGERARGATAYVTLEPCCHTGKTPPCTKALVFAGVTRVVAAIEDPHPAVAGGGVAELIAAGVTVETGLLAQEAAALIAPFATLIARRRPWVIAKWAMTLDGKLAAHTGDSKWITGDASRRVVHGLRGRVDGVLVGRGTVDADDPLLTARPAGVRVATRIVADSQASLPLTSQLVRTAREVPVLVAASAEAPRGKCDALRAQGVDVWQSPQKQRDQRLAELLDELARRQMTNVLVEGGAEVLGALFDLRAVDEVHAFVAPRLLGGPAPSPVAGRGIGAMAQALRLEATVTTTCGDDVYIHGRVAR